VGVRVFGVSRFSNKVAVIAGAEHPLGASLCQRLAGFGATVVAVGSADEPLMTVARTNPKRIEPLVLRPGRRDVLDLLREAWADEPLDYYADFMSLGPGDAVHEQSDLFRKSAGMATALQRGIQAGSALCVMAIPDAASSEGTTPEDHAKTAGYTALLKRASTDSMPGRYVGLRVRALQDAWSAADCISAGDMVLTLFHPVSRGLPNGSVIDWASEGAGA